MRQLKGSIKKSQYIRYRDRRGRLRSFSSKILLKAEVWSKTTGRRTNFILNQIKDKKPVYRRWSSKARTLYHEPLENIKSPKQIPGETFRINYSKWIQDQIPKTLTDNLNFTIEMNGYVEFFIRLTGKREVTRIEILVDTATKHFTNQRSHREWSDIIATMITAALRAQHIRTSPKNRTLKIHKSRKYWDHTWDYVRKYAAQVFYQES